MDSVEHKPRPAKVRGANLPQEMDLERLIGGLHTRHETWNSDVSACEWKGVECDADEKVMEIHWNGWELRGSLKLVHLPSSVTYFDIENNSLSGKLDLCFFSPLEKLKAFYLGINTFTGNPDLTVLPKRMTSAWMEANKLSGDLCLTQLPINMKYLDVSNNLLTGTIDLRFLPPSLCSLYLQENEFIGNVYFSFLPKELTNFQLENNRLLEGTIVESKLPPKLRAKNQAIHILNTKIINSSEQTINLFHENGTP